ncbi:MAG TPA: uroporphyrinogen-III C-methyltransferase [Solirubrobacterales bacterium]|nr:uroporphyrinogen-III C-methyltransferase [Solirubrobacterales bacterium]
MSGSPGIAYLVGAGPGDPGLMTARALELLVAADVVVYDRLIPDGALDVARPEAELIYVGKEPGKPSITQERINEMLVKHAREGKLVVRLKGGDPFVFGRGGEEAEALAAAGIPFEVVPGISAGVAAPAYAGIPVTHREEASAVAFITGHEDPAKPETSLDYDALARFPGTLVFYMGVRSLPRISERLIAAGRSASEPAAVIERGTLPGQRVVSAPLERIGAEAAEAQIKPPALTVVGPVAARREQIAWLERRPLHGVKVVVTRARAQASELSRRLEALGAEAIELPAIRIAPRTDSDELSRAVEGIHAYALVCLTSPNGVRLLFEAMAEQGRDARALANAQVAAIGPGTARALAEHGIAAEVVPERFVAESLVSSLASLPLEGKPVLLARAAEARDVLPDALRDRGAQVDVVALYDTVAEHPSEDQIEAAQSADFITFTSSSTVRNLVEALGDRMPAGARVVSIGPVTSEAVREAGLEVDVEAEKHDIDGLVAAILQAIAALHHPD